MDTELLKSAQQSLRVTDVALRATHVALADGFEPKYDGNSAEAQFMQRTSRFEVLEQTNGDQKRKLFRVFVDLGVRWVRKPKETDSSERVGEPLEAGQDILALIEATFIAEYEMSADVAPDALNEFALHNAPWHIWPYWREYVASQCARLNLAKIALPLQCLPIPSTERGAEQ